ncbi:hypothetical protein LIER_17870 [Lithospermum erythrorhizon]|uniref:Retrovirus-related Pol polyprotein from transposon TNT 1-94-like beta-barrel domain-containing protein n=1 Tax=Lithospermum erythrorhizon TaxID=34254 RepID=A0AAV3QC23_LITER
MENSGLFIIVAVGDVHLRSNLGKSIVLNNVTHIPNFRLSLISSGKLDDCGYINMFGNSQWELSRGDIEIAKGKKIGALYKASFTVCKDEINTVQSFLPLWHDRLAHMSMKGLVILSVSA